MGFRCGCEDVFLPCMTTENQDLKREQILQLSRELFMRYGIRSMTLDEVSNRAGMSKKTFYQHFANKGALVKAIVEFDVEQQRKQLEKFTTATGVNAIDKLSQIFGCWLEMFRHLHSSVMHDLRRYHPQAWDKVEGFKWQFLKQIICENMAEGMEQGLYRSDLDSEFIARLYIARGDVFTEGKVFPPHEFLISELIIKSFHFHMRAIVSEKGRRYLEQHEQTLIQ